MSLNDFDDSQFEDFSQEPENTPGGEEPQKDDDGGNRNFKLAVGIIAAIFVISLIGLGLYIFLGQPRQTQALRETAAVINANNTATAMSATQAAGLFDAFDMAARAGDMPKMEQAFADLRASYASTVQTAQAGLLLAKAQVDKGQLDAAKGTLDWVANHAGDEAYQALAHLRLAAVLMEQKVLDDALKQVSGNFPAQFAALVADRKGDILMLLDKRKEAAAAYTDAYKAFDAESPYRRLVEVKLQALGAAPEAKAANAASAPSPATKEERS